MNPFPPGHSSQSRASLRWWSQALLVLLWLAFVIAGFFWAHKPFNTRILLASGRTGAAILVTGGMVALGAGLGRRLTGRLLDAETGALRLALQSSLGLGVLALLVLGLGALRLFHPLGAWLLVLIVAGICLPHAKSILTDARHLRRPPAQTPWERGLRLFSLSMLLLALGLALAPDISWDAHVYHLTEPRLYLTWGGIAHRIDLPYLGFPQNAEMLYTLGLLLGNAQVPPLLHFSFGLMGLAITADLARRYFNRQVAWAAVALLLSGATCVLLMTRAYAEMALFCYFTATMYALLRWRDGCHAGQERRGWLWLASASVGLAGGVKYTAVVMPLAMAAIVVWTTRRAGWRAWVGRLAGMGGIAGIFVLPWLLKNWLLTGNPIYPFFLNHALYWDAWRGAFYDRAGSGLWPNQPMRLLLAPLEATILGSEGSSSYDATIGPFLLTLPLLLPLVWRALRREERRVVLLLLIFLVVNAAFWLFGLARSALLLQTRLLLPIFAPSAIMGGLVLDRLDTLARPWLRLDWLARALVNFALALLLLTAARDFLSINPLPVVVGLESVDGYYARRLGPYAAAMQAVNALPGESRVQFLWEPRSYLCRPDCRPDGILDTFLHLARGEGLDAAGIAAQWRGQGITHVLFHQAGYAFILAEQFDPVGPREQAVLADLQARYLQPIVTIGDQDYVLYQWLDDD